MQQQQQQRHNITQHGHSITLSRTNGGAATLGVAVERLSSAQMTIKCVQRRHHRRQQRRQ